VLDAAQRAGDLGPVLAVIAADTKLLIDDSFESSQAPDGSPWAPLAASTVARRRGGSSKPLIDTANLRNSMSASGGTNTLRFGTNVPYAAPHQFGYSRLGSLKTRSRGRAAGSPWAYSVPARPFLPIEGASGSYALTTSGRAGEHWQRAFASVAHYIATGEIL
jgi:phage gpG-like protein